MNNINRGVKINFSIKFWAYRFQNPIQAFYWIQYIFIIIWKVIENSSEKGKFLHNFSPIRAWKIAFF